MAQPAVMGNTDHQVAFQLEALLSWETTGSLDQRVHRGSAMRNTACLRLSI